MLKGVTEREMGTNPSKDMLAHPLIYTCPRKHCYYTVSATDEAAMSRRVELHLKANCPAIHKTHYGATVTLTLLETLWAVADDELDKLMDGELTGDKLEQQRGILTGLSRAIAVFHNPYFPSSKEVADELRLRRAAREAGEVRDTYGIRDIQYKTPEAVVPAKSAKRPATLEQRAANVGITEDGKKAIKMALGAGIMTVPQLAKMYACTEELIESMR